MIFQKAFALSMAFCCTRTSVPGLGLYGDVGPVPESGRCGEALPSARLPAPPFPATASDNTILIHGPVLKTNFGFGFLNQCLRMGEGRPLKKTKILLVST